MQNKTVCVIGLGYIGLPTAALLASNGYHVIGVDVNSDTVNIINQGKIHIVEPDLDAFVRSAVSSGRLQAQTTPCRADIFMICVPTPIIKNESGFPSPDISFVEDAIKSLAPYLEDGNQIILESTSPVGTTSSMANVLLELGVDLTNIHLAYCPERVLPGKVMMELIQNDRVVGGISPEATEMAANFYKSFVRGEVVQTDAATAEMCKLAENSYRDLNIAYANELSMLCANAGIDAFRLIELANRHPRVNILSPGVGVGGHCIAVDPWFLVAKDHENTRLIQVARQVNNSKTDWVISQIKNRINGLHDKLRRTPVVACLGVAFKADIDDLRESPALFIASHLAKLNCELLVVEPNIDKHPTLNIFELPAAYNAADLIVILVKHREFVDFLKHQDFGDKSILDYCGIL